MATTRMETSFTKAAQPPRRSAWAVDFLNKPAARISGRLTPTLPERLSGAPIPAQHAAPVFDRKQPIKKAKKTVEKMEPGTRPSLSVRDQKHCKKRPQGLQSRKPGGGTSKAFVPWCDKGR